MTMRKPPPTHAETHKEPSMARPFVDALLGASGAAERGALLREGKALRGDEPAAAFEEWFTETADSLVTGRFRRSKETGLKAALRRLFAESGEPVQISALSGEAGVTRLTVVKLVESVTAAGIMHMNVAFHGGHAKELTQFQYPYLLDPGIVTAARASLGLEPLSDGLLWEHAAVAVLRVLRREPLCYWHERNYLRIPCVCPADGGRVHAFVLGTDTNAFDPEPFRAIRVLHPIGGNYFLVPENTGPSETEAFGLPVRIVTPADIASL